MLLKVKQYRISNNVTLSLQQYDSHPLHVWFSLHTCYSAHVTECDFHITLGEMQDVLKHKALFTK